MKTSKSAPNRVSIGIHLEKETIAALKAKYETPVLRLNLRHYVTSLIQADVAGKLTISK